MQYLTSERISQEYFDMPNTLVNGPFSMFVIFFYIKIFYVLVAVYISLDYINSIDY